MNKLSGAILFGHSEQNDVIKNKTNKKSKLGNMHLNKNKHSEYSSYQSVQLQLHLEESSA